MKYKKLPKVFFIIVICIVTIALIIYLLAPRRYSAESLGAWVVDAETGIPISGVIVVAHWVLEGGAHVDDVSEFMVLETVTDEKGYFYFPAWGPKWHWGRSTLTNESPELLLFKDGYRYIRLQDQMTDAAWRGRYIPVLQSDWNNKHIKLERFKGTLEEYSNHISILNTQMRFAYDIGKCYINKVPRMVIALHKKSIEFDAAKIISGTRSIAFELYDENYKDVCGARQTLMRHLK